MKIKNKIIKKLNILLIYLLMILLFSGLVYASSYNEKNEELLGKILDLNNVSYEDITIDNNKIIVVLETSSADKFDNQLIEWFGVVFINAGLLKGENQDYKYIILQLNINKEPITYISANRVSVLDLIENRIEEDVFWTEVTITKNKPSDTYIENGGLLYNELLGINSNRFLDVMLKIFLLIISIVVIIFALLFIKNKIKNNKNNNLYDKCKIKYKELLKYFYKYSIVASKNIKKHSKVAGEQIKKHSSKAKESVKHYYDTKGKHTIKKAVKTTKDITKKTSKKILKTSKDAHTYVKDFIKNRNKK